MHLESAALVHVMIMGNNGELGCETDDMIRKHAGEEIDIVYDKSDCYVIALG